LIVELLSGARPSALIPVAAAVAVVPTVAAVSISAFAA
jgi:hypothetical protein